ncbi:MAG: ABC transporter permease, partial [Alicyclobacillus sp.]|nr:ABC transporter permease [Alicyclobacillus sp.]
MREIWRICQNEWMKLVRRRRLWVVAALGLCIVALFAAVSLQTKHNLSNMNPKVQLAQQERELQSLKHQPQTKDTKQWIDQVQARITSLKQMMKSQEMSNTAWRAAVRQDLAAQRQSFKQAEAEAKANKQPAVIDKSRYLQDQYELQHNVRPLPAWQTSTYTQSADYLDFISALFLPLLVVILVADMMAGETTSGTIKLLLVRPVSRTQILLGKWLVSCFAGVLATFAVMAGVTLAGIAVFGPQGALQPVVVGTQYRLVTQAAQIVGGPPNTFLVPVYTHAAVLPAWV